MAVCYKDILSIDKMIDVYKNIGSMSSSVGGTKNE